MLKTLIKIRLRGMFATITKKSKKKQGLGSVIGYIILGLYVFGVFFIGLSAGFSELLEGLNGTGYEWSFFALVGVASILLGLVGSIFLAQQELYNAKDNDLLLSLPIKERDIVLSRVFSILILNYVYTLLIFLPAIYAYINIIGIDVLQFLLFIIAFLTLPLIILTLTCILGWIFAMIIARAKHKNMIIILLYMFFLGGYFYFIFTSQNFIIELLQQGQELAQVVKTALPPLYFMAQGIQNTDFVNFGLYLLCMIIPFILMVCILEKNFIRLTTMKPKVKRMEYVEKPMASKTLGKALLVREFRHFTNNPIIMLNAAMGVIMTIMACAGLVYLKIDGIFLDQLQMLIAQVPEFTAIITAFLIAAITFTSSLNVITASTISLEGNRLWIIKSLPITPKQILNTKLCFHLLFCIPSGLLFAIIAIFVFELSLLDTLLVIVIPTLISIFMALFGLLLNLFKPNFNWVNENAVVKQGFPVVVTMFGGMALIGLFIACYPLYLYSVLDVMHYLYAVVVLFIIINAALYYLLQTWGIKRFNELSV